MLEMEAGKIINLKIGRVGGLSESLKIIEFSGMNNVPIWCGGMLARNKLLESPGAGGDLVRVVERVVAPQLGKNEIRLEAPEGVVSYYDETLGYEEYDVPYEDRDWGLLTPKRKLQAQSS